MLFFKLFPPILHATAIFATECIRVTFTNDAFWRGQSSFA